MQSDPSSQAPSEPHVPGRQTPISIVSRSAFLIQLGSHEHTKPAPQSASVSQA
jgi:hypothetical protein